MGNGVVDGVDDGGGVDDGVCDGNGVDVGVRPGVTVGVGVGVDDGSTNGYILFSLYPRVPSTVTLKS